MDDIVVVIPLKAFSAAKARLAASLDEPTRRRLAEVMADRVMAAANGLPVIVVTDDDDVVAWAAGHGATPLRVSTPGLDPAVRSGLAWARHGGASRAVVAHGDLPFADDLTAVAGTGDEVVIVTDRRHDGTNVLSVPLDGGFEVAYGVGSCDRHAVEADRLGLACRIVTDSPLGWDIDTPDDLRDDVLALLDDSAAAAGPGR